MLKWRRTVEYKDLVDYYKGLISLRKKLPGLCDKHKSAALRIRGKAIHADKVVSFQVDNRDFDKDVKWDELFIIYNASLEDYTIDLPAGKWEILANGTKADCCIEIPEGQRGIMAKAGSGMLLGRCG